MPEIPEENSFRAYLQDFISRSNPEDLHITALYTDVKESQIKPMAFRENRLLELQDTAKVLQDRKTAKPEMILTRSLVRLWLGALIVKVEKLPSCLLLLHFSKAFAQIFLHFDLVWERFPLSIQTQISPNYTSWSKFCHAIGALKPGTIVIPDDSHQCRLAICLNRYVPPTWRGKNPDKRKAEDIPPAPDYAWEDPIPLPTGIKQIYPSPPELHHSVHSDVFGPVAPVSLAASPQPQQESKAKGKGKAKEDDGDKDDGSKSGKKRKKKKGGSGETKETNKEKKKKPEGLPNSSLLTFGFISDKIARMDSSNSQDNSSDHILPALPPPQLQPEILKRRYSAAGVSTHLADLGLLGTSPDANINAIDYSSYFWPRHLFPELDDLAIPIEQAISKLGLFLIGIEYDPRTIILNLKQCYIEIFKNYDWLEVIRISANKGFKIVFALRMEKHTLAWLSQDNLSYIYWFSVEDIVAARAMRVPDVVFEYRKWCQYTVEWLKEQDIKPRWDKKSFGYVLTMSKNHPMRGVGRYSADEISWAFW
ncbi:hypothetical protein K438DRAFT_1778446 [Mycena galopus ATCC 62051]|nr:hypothetical protein K438DRAFT_1778446 [Mycena galopus ATCC 62051]